MTVRWMERSLRQAGVSQPGYTPPSVKQLGVWLGGLTLIAILIPLDRLWAVQLLLVPLLMVVPGVILLRALRVPGRVVASFPVYLPCASLVVLLFSGLSVDLIGPLIGVAAPLRAAPLLVGLEAICLGLLAVSVNAPPAVAIPWRGLARPGRFAWPLVVPLTAALGALRLNSDHGSGIALTALCACLVLLIMALVLAERLDGTLLTVILYAVGLAMMWSFSLRGDLVYGFDISSEYYALQHTVAAGVWHTAHTGDAYGAMLSVTVLPAELHALTGIPVLLVFKVVYPAIGALFPVGVYGLARRILPQGWAFAAASLVVVQATFFQELPALARQEIALLLFVALIAAAVHGRMPRRSRWAWVTLLALAMAVSHYSTTYMAIGILGLTLVLQWLVSWFRRIPRITSSVGVAFLAALAGALLWYGPVTHSASNVRQFVDVTQSQGLGILPNHINGSGPLGLLYAYFETAPSQPLSAAKYQQLVHHEYQTSKRFVVPLAGAGRPRYALRASAPPTPPVRYSLGFNVLNLGALGIQQLANLLGAIGALMMVLWRRTPVITRLVGVFSLATLLILSVIRLSGTLAQEYNPERAFLQATVVVAITLCWSIRAFGGYLKRPQARRTRNRLQLFILASVAISLAVLFATNSGLASTVLGGGTATNLANSGEDFERYQMTNAELASALWLGEHASRNQLIYADRYAQLPLVAMIGVPHALVPDITPMTLDRNAWVYASTTNVSDGRARALFGGRLVIYRFPLAFLKAKYDTVYTDGSSEVFHR